MHCFAIMWVTLLDGKGIIEHAVQYNYNIQIQNIKIVSETTSSFQYSQPMYASEIKKQMKNLDQIPGYLFENVEWGKAKYFYADNYFSFCNSKLKPVKKLRKLSYYSFAKWKPKWNFDRRIKADNIPQLDREIDTVGDLPTLNWLILLSQKKWARFTGNACFFPQGSSSLSLPNFNIKNGVLLKLVSSNQYVETLLPERVCYTFIADNINGFQVATVHGYNLHYSKDNLINFLRESYFRHTWGRKDSQVVSQIFEPGIFIIGHDVGSV